MNYMQDLFNVLTTAFKETLQNIKNVPLLAGVICGALVMYRLLGNVILLLLGRIPYIGGLISYLYTAYCVALVANILDDIISNNKINTRTMFIGSSYSLSKVIQIGFAIYILELAANLVLQRLNPSIIAIIYFIIMILFSAVLEAIYSENYSGYETLFYSINFVRDNLIQWVPINVVFLLILYPLQKYLYPSFDVVSIALNLGLSIVLSVILIYKGKLYRLLAHSSIRKRNFKRQFD